MDIEHVFSYHKPTEEQISKMQDIRYCARELAYAISVNVPDGADKSAALRKLRECVMTANAGIVLDGQL